MIIPNTDQAAEHDVSRLLESAERYRTLFSAIDVALCVIEVLFDGQGSPHDYRFLETNSAFERHTGLVDPVGKTVRDLVPELSESWFGVYGNVALTGEAMRLENYEPSMGRWFEVFAQRVGPTGANQVGILFSDITARKSADSRERARLNDIFMRAPAFMAALRGPQHVIDLANQPYFQLIGREDIIGKTVAEALPEVVEQGFIELLDRVYQTGEAYRGEDTRVVFQVDSGSAPKEHYVNFTYQALFDEDGAVSGILVHGVGLTDRKRLEQEQQRLLAEAQTRVAREALINQIGEAARAAMEPIEVLSIAVKALGQTLKADRCYYAIYDRANDFGRIGPDWHHAELTSIAGNYRLSDYPINRDSRYHSGITQVLVDAHEFRGDIPDPSGSERGVSLQDRLGLRSLIRVQVQAEGVVAALAVAMSSGPRHWTEDEVRLVETIAAQTRAAVESVRVQRRERHIATQLQEALQPPAPPQLPGLDLASYYRPALAEASVGGDFFDVFDVEKGCTALVVADLSGKGLAAAQQVATVRNMLRFALYKSRSVAEAVTDLHDALVEHDLLTGFATLFVGVYDHHQRTLTYVNCGQEPGLIWQAATDSVMQLPPTGPVLGGFAAVGGFQQRTIGLSDGDALALFTDGLTDVGPSRKQLLGVENVSDLLRECCTEARGALSPQTIVEGLIRAVDRFGRGGVRDDIALLVGVVSRSKRNG